jgi:hypothetical protein
MTLSVAQPTAAVKTCGEAQRMRLAPAAALHRRAPTRHHHVCTTAGRRLDD